MLFICLLIPQLFHYSASVATPMYTYIKELCPPGLMPLTGARHVRTCDKKCPRGSNCIQGVCCTRPPQCNHFTYKYPSQYSCLPRVKQNCPDGQKCVPSTNGGMHICCSARAPRASPIPPEKAVCPASHPVISSDRQHLRLCSECEDGVCVPFRSSSVSICCHSSTTFCGPGSTVEMDGLLARDCTKMPCSQGYECSLAPLGNRVCCSLAECSSGQRARAICAAGCRQDEICEVINGQRWCCPMTQKRCSENKLSNGSVCSPTSLDCGDGYECEESDDQRGYLCCQAAEEKHTTVSARARTFSKNKLATNIASQVQATLAPVPITFSPMPITPIVTEGGQRCVGGALPMLMDGEYLRCPQIGAPCPKAGYVCESGSDGLYCCPMEDYVSEKSILPLLMTPPTIHPDKCIDCENKASERPSPKCPFAFREARHDTRDEIKTCTGFLDFSCPFGFTCLPSSTTASFLCCAQNILA